MEEINTSLNSSTSKNNLLIVVLISLTGLILLTKSFFPSRLTSSTTPQTLKETTKNTPASTTSSSNENTRIISLDAGSFFYQPNHLTVTEGQKVEIVIHSLDSMHDFVIDELGVNTPIANMGNKASVEFTPDKVGEFQFYCSIGNHRAQGMVGTITVTSSSSKNESSAPSTLSL